MNAAYADYIDDLRAVTAGDLTWYADARDRFDEWLDSPLEPLPPKPVALSPAEQRRADIEARAAAVEAMGGEVA